MCRYVSSNNRRVGEGAAKVSEAVSGAPVRVDSGRNGIYVKFGTGATAEDKGNVAAKFSQFRIDSVSCQHYSFTYETFPTPHHVLCDYYFFIY